MSIFNNRLKELRIERELTQLDMADKMDVNRVTYTNWENGKREPRIDQIVELAGIINTTINYLMGKIDINILDLSNDELEMSPEGMETVKNELMNNFETILKAGQLKFSVSDEDMKNVFLKIVEDFANEN